MLITRQNRDQTAGEALKWIAGGVRAKQGAAVLDALGLLDGDQLRPRQSRYATAILDQLQQKRQGQVLNRTELVQDEDGIEYWTAFRLEPEFLAVVLASLVQSGSLVLSLPGRKIGAGSVEDLSRIPARDLAQFKHIERPKGLPIEPLRELFSLLHLPEGKLAAESTRNQAAADLQVAVASRVQDLVLAQSKLQNGLAFWGRPVLSEHEGAHWSAILTDTKNFLESLQAFNTAGKLNNFPYDVAAVTAKKTGLALVREVENLAELIAEVGVLAGLPVDRRGCAAHRSPVAPEGQEHPRRPSRQGDQLQPARRPQLPARADSDPGSTEDGLPGRLPRAPPESASGCQGRRQKDSPDQGSAAHATTGPSMRWKSCLTSSCGRSRTRCSASRLATR